MEWSHHVPILRHIKHTKTKSAYLFPLGNEVAVGVFFVDAVVIELAADGFPAVIQVIYVSRALVMQPHNGPDGLDPALAIVLVILSCGCT